MLFSGALSPFAIWYFVATVMAAETISLIVQIHSRTACEGGKQMWGQLCVDRLGRVPGGWLINSWSELDAPYWENEFHWFDKKTNKLHITKLNLAQSGGEISILEEDTEIEAERAAFIRHNIDRWELEWLENQMK